MAAIDNYEPTMSLLSPPSRPHGTFQTPEPLPTGDLEVVSVYHPAFTGASSSTLLFSCPALDPYPEDPNRRGCSHRLVMDAMYIIANNKPGKLAKQVHPEADYITTDNLLLPPGDYYYVVINDPSMRYPIVKALPSWTFPQLDPTTRRNIPAVQHWGHFTRGSRVSPDEIVSRSAMSDGVRFMDRSCIISGTPNSTFLFSLCVPILTSHSGSETCQCVHLVPKCHPHWFKFNKMGQFSASQIDIHPDHVANGVTLRADLHLLLDHHSLVFYPCQDPVEYMVYFLSDVPPYPNLYHRCTIKLHPRVNPAYLYARFAYNVISAVKATDVDEVPVTPQYETDRKAWQVKFPSRKSNRRRNSNVTGSRYTPTEPTLTEEGMYPSPFAYVASSSETVPTDMEVDDESGSLNDLVESWIAKNQQICQMSGESGDIESLPVAGSVVGSVADLRENMLCQDGHSLRS